MTFARIKGTYSTQEFTHNLISIESGIDYKSRGATIAIFSNSRLVHLFTAVYLLLLTESERVRVQQFRVCIQLIPKVSSVANYFNGMCECDKASLRQQVHRNVDYIEFDIRTSIIIRSFVAHFHPHFDNNARLDWYSLSTPRINSRFTICALVFDCMLQPRCEYSACLIQDIPVPEVNSIYFFPEIADYGGVPQTSLSGPATGGSLCMISDRNHLSHR